MVSFYSLRVIFFLWLLAGKSCVICPTRLFLFPANPTAVNPLENLTIQNQNRKMTGEKFPIVKVSLVSGFKAGWGVAGNRTSNLANVCRNALAFLSPGKARTHVV
jgi:hypothetical protein